MNIKSESEIRGVLIHWATITDWYAIAETLAQYKINLLVFDFARIVGWTPYNPSVLDAAIAACHARGIEVHAMMEVFYTETVFPDTAAESNTHTQVAWTCPTKQATRNKVRSIVEEAARHNVDGFMFDYIRYESASGVSSKNICFCSECKAAFEKWLGESITDVQWTTDFGPGGARERERMEWRVLPITELVRDVRNWMTAIKPNLEFSAAVFHAVVGAPEYHRYWIGQDTSDWVAKGYLDFVVPMHYGANLTQIRDRLILERDLFVGGPEGMIPIAVFITSGLSSVNPFNPTTFTQVVETIRSLGLDGWIIWKYGGPGVTGWIDISPYLDNIRNATADGLFETFSLNSINVDPTGKVTWSTKLPATSRVEYSASPLFVANYKVGTTIHYWDIDHILGAVREDLTPITSHSITLTDLTLGTKYYYRVQSEGGGVASSRVYTFIAGESPTPISPFQRWWNARSHIEKAIIISGVPLSLLWYLNMRRG